MLLGLLSARLVAEDSVALEPVEVVAARVADPLVSLPAAVTAYDGAFLDAQGITRYDELAPLVPGLFVSIQSPDNVSLNLRGITSDDRGDPTLRPRVSVMQDGVMLVDSHGQSVALFDLDRVEVFKGPQPSAFGRGVQTGALALSSNPARNETSGALTVGAGDHDRRTAEGCVNAPLVPGKLFARVAVFFDQSDGFITNLADGSDLQGRDTAALRTSLRWQPEADTTADLVFNHERDTPPGIDFKSAVIPTSPVGGNTDPYTAANLTRGSDLGVDRTITGLTGTVRHAFNPDWSLASVSAWRQADSRNEFDGDGSRLYLLEPRESSHGTQLSQELRLAYAGDERLTATLGAGVAHDDTAQSVLVRTDEAVLWRFLTGFPPSTLPGAVHRYSEHYTIDSTTTSFDAFGRADYRLTPKLTVGAGLRVTEERIVSGYESFAAATPGHINLLPAHGGGNDFFKPTAGRLETETDAASWSGKVDARYAFTPGLTGYAAVSRGRRPPVLGFDKATLQPFELHEETVWNYETGVRGFTPGRRVRYDLSVFQYYFDHFQTERVTGPGITQPVDAGRARGQGFEGTLQTVVTHDLTLFATYGFTDAKFSANDDDGRPQAYAGNMFRLTSRHTLSLGGTFTVPVRRGAVFVTPSVTYRSEHFFEDDNASNGGILRQGGFALVNLRIGYRAASERWEVVGYVDNLFDKHYLTDAGNIGASYGIPTNIPGEFRTVGAKLTVRF